MSTKIHRSLHQAIIKLMLLSLLSSTLAGLIPPHLVQQLAPSLTNLLPETPVALAAGTITGTVFVDYNGNGVFNTTPTTGGGVTDIHIAGVTVTAYDSAGASQGTTTTVRCTGAGAPQAFCTGADIGPNYSLVASGTGPYRVEFTTLPAGYQSSARGATSGTSVQFVPDGIATASLGVLKPSEYSQDNPLLANTWFRKSQDAGQPAPDYGATVVTIDPTTVYNGIPEVNFPSQPLGPHVGLTTSDVTGAIYGLAWQRSSKSLFASSFGKVNAPTPLAAGGSEDGPNARIYRIDPAGPTTTVFLDFEVMFGTDSAGDTTPGFGRAMPDQVGKILFGDLDISEDDSTLWLVNLFTRELWKLPIGSPPMAPTAGQISKYPMPVPANCTVGDQRPGGLGIADGKVYAGMVCTDESNPDDFTRAHLRAYVYEFDPETTAFTQRLDFSLDYARHCVGTISNCHNWYPWSSGVANTAQQPWLTDIVFDHGDMVLGFRTRKGDQASFAVVTEGAETLRACRTAPNTWALESNGTCGGASVTPVNSIWVVTGWALPAPPQLGAPNTQGPGGGEWYWEDDGKEGEATHGALAIIAGARDVFYTHQDGVATSDHAGVGAFNNATGRVSGANSFLKGAYGKDNNLGDLEVLSNPAPLELGNRVWNDLDNDGLQDPNEAPINGVIVELYKNGVKVGQATTDATGEYYFTSGTSATDANTNDNIIHDSGLGILPATGTSGANSLYEIRIPDVSGGSKQAVLGTNTLTRANIGGDAIDSDGTIPSGQSYASYPIPYANLAGAGYNNHTYDFGFGPVLTTGTIQIIKNTTGGNGAFGYTSPDATLDAIHLTTSGGTASSTVMTFNAGSYTLSEDPLVGWSLTNLQCAGDSDNGSVVTLASRRVTIDLDASENIVCTFSNTAQPSSVTPSGVLTLTKTVIGNPGGVTNYAVTVNGPSGYVTNTTVTAGVNKVLTGLAGGIYTVTETSPGAGWVTTYTVSSAPATVLSGQAVVNLTNASSIAAFAAVPVSGRVYNDFNSDGLISTGTVADTGVANVKVTAYGVSGAACGNVTSNATGNYSFTPTCAGPWRLVFSDLPAGYEPSTHGTANGTSVQFVTTAAGATGVNFGVNLPAEYCQSNPLLCTARLDSGSGVGNTGQGFVSFPYDVSGAQLQYGGTAANMHADATVDQVGTVWGVAYQSTQRRLFTAAYLKRHIAFADGPGYVYVLDYRTTPASVAGSFNLQGITPANGGATIDLGTVTRANVAGAISAGAAGDNQLPASASAPSRDLDAFAKVGKMSFGDIDLSEDKRTLWLVNLYQQALIAVDVSGATGSLPGSVNQYLLSNLAGTPTCTNGSFRPWALKFYHGKGYVGGVCDGATGSRTNLRAYVLSFTPTNIAAGLTTEIQFALPQSRIAGDGGAASWRPWISTYAETANPANDFAIFQASLPTGNYGIYPQPILSDIEFQPDGAMILGFRDRLGDQLGQNNYKALSGNTALESLFSWGDMLKACKVGAAYVIEGAAGCPVNYSGAFGVSGNGEYFYDEMGDGAAEGASGGLALLPGANEVATTIVDPKPVNVTGYSAAYINSQGLHWNNLTNGAQTDWYQITPEQFPAGTPINSLAKANGLGDLEILCDAAPIEIGNRVWNDLNGDGVQDANEPGLNGLTVSLQGPTNTVTTNTDVNGLYYFGNGSTTSLKTNTAYTLTMNVPAGYSLTAANQAALSGASVQSNHAISDTIDSDAALVGGKATIYYSTGSAGQNNHGLDFGFTQPVKRTVNIFNKAPSPATTIQIIKNTTGGNSAFGYTSANATLDAIHLTTVGGTASSAVMSMVAGSYTLSEDQLVGWSLTSLACTGDTDNGSVVTLASRQVTIDLDSGENIVCTFSNTAQPSSVTPSNVLTLTKTVIGNPGGVTSYAVMVNGPNGYVTNTTVTAGVNKVLTGLAGGLYTVTETSPGAGWVTTYTVSSAPATVLSGQAVVDLSNASSIAAFAAVPVSGRVYRDFNSDGSITANGTITDTGVANVKVAAYGVSGAACNSATSNATGNYSFTPTCAGPWRLVFSDLPAGYEPTTHGPSAGSGSNGTSTQFITTAAGANNISFGINHPCDYCQSNPNLATTKYVNGDPLLTSKPGGGSVFFPTKDFPAWIQFPYNSGATGAAVVNNSPPASGTTAYTTLSNAGPIGTLWGLAYQRESKRLFGAAVVRRHAGLGPLGTGGIYMADLSGGTPTISSFVNLAAAPFNLDTGSFANPRGLDIETASPSHDDEAFGMVGKAGLGALDISADGTYLWLVNLKTRTLHKLAINNPAQTPTLASALSTPANQPWLSSICPNGLERPWAVKMYRAKLYVGTVCTAENSGTAADLSAQVYEYDGTSFTKLLTIPLNYTKGAAYASAEDPGQWYPWLDVYSDAAFNKSGSTVRTQPILSAIEFDANTGNMILGFTDRNGLQFGYQNYKPDGTTNTITGITGGDILLACKSAGAWVVESNGQCPAGSNPSAAGVSNNQGPGNGEFFYDDRQGDASDPTNLTKGVHKDIHVGALAVLPGANDVAMTAMDPFRFATSGLAWLYTANGANERRYEVYQQGTGLAKDRGSFAKAAGLGDLQLLCDPAPIEIGNRVWNDLDGDGVQDANEPGLANITVSRQGPTNTVTVNTDANGLYYFGNGSTTSLKTNTAYTLTMNVPAGYSLTAANQAALSGASVQSNHAISDTIDSDAGLVGSKATIYYSTGSAGQNNHGLDFGFTQPVKGQVDITNTAPTAPPSFTLRKQLLTPDPIRVGDDITFTIRITNTGSTPITVLPLRDFYNVSDILFDHANVLPDDSTNDGQLDWSDLTASFSQDLAAGASFTVTTIFVARHDTSILPGGATINTARVLITPTQTVTAPVRIEAPTAVDLVSYNARYDLNNGVTLQWTTASEANIAGFHLLRREPGRGGWVRLNPEMIPAQQPGQATGASYSFTDATAAFGHTYLYLVEVVDGSGNASRRELGLVVAGSRVSLPVIRR